jgi:hypothetical protein
MKPSLLFAPLGGRVSSSIPVAPPLSVFGNNRATVTQTPELLCAEQLCDSVTKPRDTVTTILPRDTVATMAPRDTVATIAPDDLVGIVVAPELTWKKPSVALAQYSPNDHSVATTAFVNNPAAQKILSKSTTGFSITPFDDAEVFDGDQNRRIFTNGTDLFEERLVLVPHSDSHQEATAKTNVLENLENNSSTSYDNEETKGTNVVERLIAGENEQEEKLVRKMNVFELRCSLCRRSRFF